MAARDTHDDKASDRQIRAPVNDEQRQALAELRALQALLRSVSDAHSWLRDQFALAVDRAMRSGIQSTDLARYTFAATHNRAPSLDERRREASRLRQLKKTVIRDHGQSEPGPGSESSDGAMVDRATSKGASMYRYPFWPYGYPYPPPQGAPQPQPTAQPPASPPPPPQPGQPPYPAQHPGQPPYPAPPMYFVPVPAPWYPPQPPAHQAPPPFPGDDDEE